MKRETKPFRITLILDGDNAVAQLEQMERVIDDDGVTVISSRALPAEPLEFPLSEKILGQVASDALAKIATLEADLKTATEEKDEAVKAKGEAETSNNNAMALLASRTLELETARARITELETPPPVATVSIRAWQAKAVLQLSGLLEAAESIIDGLEEPQRTVVLSAWTNNADFARTSPTILALAAALGLTDEQLDGMFSQAAALAV